MLRGRRSPDGQDRIKSNMRMDRTRNNATRISDPSHPAGKRKEIDNVMKKARQQPTNEYWDKKLLEAEEKDPNRWKHSGYKKMYVNGERKSPAVSPRALHARQHIPPSPVRRRMSRTPERPSDRYGHGRPKSPPRYARKSPPRPRTEMVRNKEPYRAKRPMSPPSKARTPSPSISSCSDSQCSGCSSDEDTRRIVEPKRLRMERHHGVVNRMRPMSPDEHVAQKKARMREMSPGAKRRHLKRPSPVVEKSRREMPSPVPTKKKDKSEKTRTRIKIEGEKRRHRSPSTASEDSTSSDTNFPALTASTRITLNERFSKMAQWNHDRKYDMNNMKITKNSEGGDRSAVMIQEQNIRESPIQSFSFTQYSRGEGHYPEELMQRASAQEMGLCEWDDVRVRFDYYKSKGYLRDLTLQDYIKYEEWWYRYQEWLKQERYFENRMIERRKMRRRRKKLPIQQRLN